MMANCSPADYNFDETLSTLRYASRAKFIKNKPVINEDPKDALLKEYSNEIQKLRAMLEERSVSKSMPVSQVNLMFDERLKEKEQELRNEKEEKQMLMAKIK